MINTCIQLNCILGKKQQAFQKRARRPLQRNECPGDNEFVHRLRPHSHFTAGTELLDNAKFDVWNCLQIESNFK